MTNEDRCVNLVMRLYNYIICPEFNEKKKLQFNL